MGGIQSKINKLCMALKIKGYIYLINKEQFYSKKIKKVCTANKLIRLMPVAEYNKLYPNNKKDPNKYENVKVEVLKSFSNIDILIKLAEIYRQVIENE